MATDLTTPDLEDKRLARGEVRSVSESEDTIRNLKASQSVEAAFNAVGIPSPPPDVAAIITSQVKSTVRGLSSSQVANMTPGSGLLGTAAMQAVDQYLSALSPSQLAAAKNGLNKLTPLEMLRLQGRLNSLLGPWGNAPPNGGNGTSTSSARYDGVSTGSIKDWSSPAGMAYMRDYALKKGVGWAADNREILKLGPSAIDVIAQTRFRKETYTELRNVGLSARGSVGIAAIAKQRGDDANTFGSEIAKNLRTLNDRSVTSAVDGFAATQIDPNATPQRKDSAFKLMQQRLDESAKKDPGHAPIARKLKEELSVKGHEAAVVDNTHVAAAINNDATRTAALALLDDDPPANNPSPAQSAASQGKKVEKPGNNPDHKSAANAPTQSKKTVIASAKLSGAAPA